MSSSLSFQAPIGADCFSFETKIQNRIFNFLDKKSRMQCRSVSKKALDSMTKFLSICELRASLKSPSQQRLVKSYAPIKREGEYFFKVVHLKEGQKEYTLFSGLDPYISKYNSNDNFESFQVMLKPISRDTYSIESFKPYDSKNKIQDIQRSTNMARIAFIKTIENPKTCFE